LDNARSSSDLTKKRINVKKILSLQDVVNKPYSKITIELKENFDLDEIKKILSQTGSTKVDLVFHSQNKKANYSLQNNRKIDLSHIKALKAKKYVTKITV